MLEGLCRLRGAVMKAAAVGLGRSGTGRVSRPDSEATVSWSEATPDGTDVPSRVLRQRETPRVRSGPCTALDRDLPWNGSGDAVGGEEAEKCCD